jgi:hypothetical protein
LKGSSVGSIVTCKVLTIAIAKKSIPRSCRNVVGSEKRTCSGYVAYVYDGSFDFATYTIPTIPWMIRTIFDSGFVSKSALIAQGMIRDSVSMTECPRKIHH